MRRSIAAALLFTLGSLHIDLTEPADAQQAKKIPRIGYLTGVSRNAAPEEEAFRHGLRDLGYVDGKNIFIESRYAEGKLDRIPSLVNELVQREVDILVAANNAAILAAKQATKVIP